MTVNGACSVIEHADHCLSGHTDKAELFAAARRRVFPSAPSARWHATVVEKHRHEASTLFPSVTDWWDKSFARGATSAAKAAAIGLDGLGFDEVILCGCPLDGSGYVRGEASVGHDCHRVGDPAAQTRRVIEGYRLKYRKFADTYRGRVFSMSGFTMACSGAPTE
jgi:hypothetical protein